MIMGDRKYVFLGLGKEIKRMEFKKSWMFKAKQISEQD